MVQHTNLEIIHRVSNPSKEYVDCLFINPRDMVGAFPYVKLAYYAGGLIDAGLHIKFIDPAPSELSQNEVFSIIDECKPAIICLSAFPSTLPDAYQIVQYAKKTFPEITIVLEGYHVNADPEIILHMGADYGLVGDAEFSFKALCISLINGEDPELCDGIAYNDNGTLVFSKAAVIQDINDLPLPAYNLLPIGHYYSASTDKAFMVMFTTRGCPYDCNFCAFPLQRNFRVLTIDNVIRQLHILVKELGVQWVEFMDLTFTVSRKRTLEFCEAIMRAELVFEWGCETRADLVDKELLLVMKKAGCSKITFGVESGDETVRFKTGKKISNQQFLEVFTLCREIGIKTMANFIIGHPGETEKEVKATIQFSKQLRPFNVFFTRMTPLPDIEIFSEGVKSGEIDPMVWVKYMKGEMGHPVYYPSSLSKEKLERLYRLAFAKYYFSTHAIKQYLPLLTNFQFLRKSVLIFLRIVFGSPVFK